MLFADFILIVVDVVSFVIDLQVNRGTSVILIGVTFISLVVCSYYWCCFYWCCQSTIVVVTPVPNSP